MSNEYKDWLADDNKVFITGDCHADFTKFTTDNFPQQKELTRDDIVIVCGDFGIWHDTPEERYWLKWLANKSFTICFCDGNHENFDRLYSDEFEVVDFHGGKAHKIRENVFHLMRGYIFDFEDKKFFVMGGAQSHDIDDGILDATAPDFPTKYKEYQRKNKMFRVDHYSWWKEEIPSFEELCSGISNLAGANWQVDYIISHCLPQSVAACAGYYGNDELVKYFDDLLGKIDFYKWYCGHYHTEQSIMNKYIIKYQNIERII